ncbi:MAG TPA: hypothetical protein VIR30_18875, partial [Nocardioides sp.]
QEVLDPVVEEVIKPVDNLISTALARTLCVIAIPGTPTYSKCVSMLVGQENTDGIITQVLRSLGLAR